MEWNSGDQCSWFTNIHEFTSQQTCYKDMNCLKCGSVPSYLPMKPRHFFLLLLCIILIYL